MAIKVSQLRSVERETTIEYEGEMVTLRFAMGRITPDAIGEVTEEAGVPGIVALLADVLTAWDVLGEDDQPIAITRETLGKLPILFLRALLDAIQAAAFSGTGELDGKKPRKSTQRAAAPA